MNSVRIGNFTSSRIWALMSKNRKGDDFGAPALTYIKSKKWEKRLGRTLDIESGSKACAWGTLLEKRAFDLMPSFDSALQSQETLAHPTIAGWYGSPDYIDKDLVGDIKCPWTLNAFCELVDSIETGSPALAENHKEYYWQLVSNAIITGKKYAELTVYCPFQDELETIREMARSQDEDQQRYAFINFALDEDLPYLVNGCGYKNMYQIRFEIPGADKEALTSAVQRAITY